MTTQALFAQGTQLQRGDGADPEVFTTVAEARSIKGPNQKADTIDVTSHSSPLGQREFISGLIDNGDVTFTINYVPTDETHIALRSDLSLRVRGNWKLVLVDDDGTTFEFEALVVGFSLNAPVDNAYTADITLKVGAYTS